MGDYTHAERTYLFAYLSESGIYRNINEWCSKGVTPQIDNLQSVSYTDMPVWHETFLAGDMIIIPELSAIRQTMPAEYRLLVAQDIRSLTAFPPVPQDDARRLHRTGQRVHRAHLDFP